MKPFDKSGVNVEASSSGAEAQCFYDAEYRSSLGCARDEFRSDPLKAQISDDLLSSPGGAVADEFSAESCNLVELEERRDYMTSLRAAQFL
jgi:hypothetical protein